MPRLLFNLEIALDKTWIYVVSRNGKNFALFAYISALTPVPALASVCHQIDGTTITEEEIRELGALIKQRGGNGGWLFDGVYPWLVTPIERNNAARREIERQNNQLHIETRTAAPRHQSKIKSSRG
jgi:hypothetical protein